MRSFRKQSFKDRFDFNLIYQTTDEAVRSILNENKEPEIIANVKVFDVNDDDTYPEAAYKAENDSYYYDDEYETYVYRF